MLTVIKRSGREEPFDAEKIKSTAAAASDELHSPLNESDIQNIAADVSRQLEGRDKITTSELYLILIQTMKKRGFTDLAKAYAEYATNFWINN